MKESIAILAAAGLTSAAIAQSDGWILEFDQTELSPDQPSVWVTLSATFPADDYAFNGARLSLSASESGWGALEKLPGSWGPGTTSGVAVGGTVTGMLLGQIHFPYGILAHPRNPLPLWRGQFTVTDFRARDIEFATDTSDFRVYPDIVSSVARRGTPIEAHQSIRVVPAPAGGALMALGALAAVRRQR